MALWMLTWLRFRPMRTMHMGTAKPNIFECFRRISDPIGGSQYRLYRS